jgi:hypothetical protein
MKHQNLVLLDGVLGAPQPVLGPLERFRPADRRARETGAGPPPLVDLQGASGLAVLLATDQAARGGHHLVLLPRLLAIETWAFLQANGGRSVDATVQGWLCSHDGVALVMAEVVRFHVSAAVRRAAAQKITALLGEIG